MIADHPRRTCRIAALVLALATPVAGARQAPPALGIPGVSGGVVATTEPHAARAGAAILRAGGNAVDAAAAVAFALNVVEPQSSGIGGGGFMVVYLADSGETYTIDSRESAPAAADAQMFMPFVSGRVPVSGFSGASTSGLAVGVPGMVRGIDLALSRWGSKGLEEVLAPAIALAAGGFRIGPRLAESVRHPRLGNEPGVAAYERARRVFRPGGKPLVRDTLLVQPELAKTLRLIAREGATAFYEGPVAKAIVATQHASRGGAQAGRGRMTLTDLAGYRAKVREPVVGGYRGYTIKGMGPPSSGGLTVLQILGMLERLPLGDRDAGFGFAAPKTLHTMIEAMRLAFADRAVWMGDSDQVAVPVQGLLAADYLAKRSALIDTEHRRKQVSAGDPRAFDPAFSADGDPATPAAATAGGRNTTHFSIVDGEGNVVSYTNTIESAWGTGLMVPGYGFMLNNELTDFNFRPRARGDGEAYDPGANDAAPGKRPRSSISPVIVFAGDEPVAAYGSPGGPTIINTVVNVTLNLVDHDMTMQEAVDAPRVSQTSATGEVSWEGRLDATSLAALEKLGHELGEPREIGAVQAVVIDPETGKQYGAADRRRTGAVRSVTSPAP